MDLYIKDKFSLKKFDYVELIPNIDTCVSKVAFYTHDREVIFYYEATPCDAIDLLDTIAKAISYSGSAHFTSVVFDARKFPNYRDLKITFDTEQEDR